MLSEHFLGKTMNGVFGRNARKFYMDIHADIVYSHTGYDVIIYFRSEVNAKKLSKIPLPTASGGISREWFKQGSRYFAHFSKTICFTNFTAYNVTI